MRFVGVELKPLVTYDPHLAEVMPPPAKAPRVASSPLECMMREGLNNVMPENPPRLIVLGEMARSLLNTFGS
jgi:hypothetical protein